MQIQYKEDLDGVDWRQMKAILQEDEFDNGRTPEQLAASFTNSYATCIACLEGKIIGTARALSDGVCNAYIVDVWTYSPYRRQGIARQMMARLLAALEGQHVYLFTDDAAPFYRSLGFTVQGTGMARVVGSWLVNKPGQGSAGRSATTPRARRIEHVALWTHDLERLKTFYEVYFGAEAGARYHNHLTGFQSCFLSFPSGARLELMHREDIIGRSVEQLGYAHIAFATGSPTAVDRLTARLVSDGYKLVDGPRWTGDGYYESVFLDPDGNRVEITV